MSLRYLYALLCCVLTLNIAHAAPAPDSFADLAETVTPAVVNISSKQFPKKVADRPPRQREFRFFGPQGRLPEGMPEPFNDFFDEFFRGFPGPFSEPFDNMPKRPQNSLGSGFIIDAEEGLLITNNHVVEGADEVEVTLYDDSTYDAEIVGRDAKTDIAVLRIEPNGKSLTEVEWGNSDQMRVGDWVLAVGNPFGLGGTVTAGIVSARQRDIQAGPYDDFIQTDASINRGNSGGPMFNINGKVIGINTAIFSPTGGSVGIGFAVPSNLAQSVVDQLVEYGGTKRGWLGVRIQEVTEDIAESLDMKETKGALISDVTEEGPADEAGIKTGDIVLSFDGKDVSNMRQLPRIVAETDVGKTVDVVIQRQGENIKKKVKLGQLEKAEEEGLLDNMLAESKEDKIISEEIESLGIELANLNDQLREEYQINDRLQGVLITDVDPDSYAAQRGVREGGVLTEVNQTPVRNIKDVRHIVSVAEDSGRPSVLLLIRTSNSVRFVGVRLNTETDDE